jgi:hypothetical protein
MDLHMIAFDTFLILKKITHSLRRSALGKRNLYRQNYNYALEQLPKKIPNIIWIYWNGPIDEAPPFVQYAIKSWSAKNINWKIHVLSDETLAEFIEPPTADHMRMVQAKSDVIRLSLLNRYGGVWVDATCSCVLPLDHWLLPLMQSGFFAFPDTYPGRIIQSWFLASEPRNYLIEKWREKASQYYKKRGRLLHYFWVMHLFEYIVRTDKRAATIWAATPKISAKGPILLKRMLSDTSLAESIPLHINLEAIPVLKISSITRSEIEEFRAAMEENRDIDLRKIASHLVSNADENSSTGGKKNLDRTAQ